MKQRHSFHRLFYHLVFSTKNREHLFVSSRDGDILSGYFRIKAKELDAYVEEFGHWREHVHMLLRSAPSLALANLYGQFKGFSSYAWNRKYADRPLVWQDGVFITTVDPDDNRALREYVATQWSRHESRAIIESWEIP